MFPLFEIRQIMSCEGIINLFLFETMEEIPFSSKEKLLDVNDSHENNHRYVADID